MSNYVWNKVVCRKEILEQYFFDFDPLGDGTSRVHPYISFNKLFGVKSLNEYSDKFGVHIDYGSSFSWQEKEDGRYEIKFCTRWEYPIRAIVKAIELAHDTEWYAVEENHIYLSRFYWSCSVKEDIMFLGDEFYMWDEEHPEIDKTIQDPDNSVWYYLPFAKGRWKNWDTRDGFARYRDVPAVKLGTPPVYSPESSSGHEQI